MSIPDAATTCAKEIDRDDVLCLYGQADGSVYCFSDDGQWTGILGDNVIHAIKCMHGARFSRYYWINWNGSHDLVATYDDRKGLRIFYP